jgi:hypothetical protein
MLVKERVKLGFGLQTHNSNFHNRINPQRARRTNNNSRMVKSINMQPRIHIRIRQHIDFRGQPYYGSGGDRSEMVVLDIVFWRLGGERQGDVGRLVGE